MFQFIRAAVFACACFGGVCAGLAAQNRAAPPDVPLRRVHLYSSGVGFFEHAGSVSGNATLRLPFSISALNDALKSLVINDSASAAPQVSYPSETTFWRTLQSLKIDISGDRGIVDILRSMKGAEVAISTPAQVVAPVAVSGRIVAVDSEERLGARGEVVTEVSITLSTASGLRVIPLKHLQKIVFKDKQIEADLQRALNVLGSFRQGGRELVVDLPGAGRRDVALSYVIPTPVWKVSYRLDVDAKAPFLQGWAIVDNDGDVDWHDVELSLITGRQVSFSQNLYEPYYQARPNVPLAIAGVAEARTYEDALVFGGAGESDDDDEAAFEGALFAAPSRAEMRPAPVPLAGGMQMRKGVRAAGGVAADAGAPLASMYGGEVSGEQASEFSDARGRLAGAARPQAAGRDAGEQFEYTFQKPVSLARQQSTMLPLLEAPVAVRKILIFSGERSGEALTHPQVSAELVNNTGMKLPAGAITVFDGGAYAGDALLNFFPEGETRYISFGEDLTVSGSSNLASSRVIQTVRISKGLVTVTRNLRMVRTYVFRNSAAAQKDIVIEHPVSAGMVLRDPERAEGETARSLRFERSLPAASAFVFAVTEERPLEESLTLARLSVETLLSYSSSADLPERVRGAFTRALELRQAVEDIRKELVDLDERSRRLSAEQERIRKNLEAAGRGGRQGAAYRARLTALDKEIDACAAQAEKARERSRTAQNEYELYVLSLEL